MRNLGTEIGRRIASTGSGAAALRRLLAQARVPYRGLSLDVASRLGGGLSFVLAGLALLVAPFEPPMDTVAWLILAGNVGVWLLVGLLLSGGYWVQSPNMLLFCSYIASAQIMALVISGHFADSLYMHLYIVPLICVSAVHPLRRWLLYYVVLTLLVIAPITFDATASSGSHFFGTAVLQLILWLGLGFVILLMMSDVRAQRRQLELEQSEASRLARLDSLTGLGNQRGFWEAIHSEVAHAQRTYRPLSIVLADLDHFKRVNDQFGHREGDELLARVGVALARTARTSDECFRYGGEEFVVILRDVDLTGSMVAAERFRASVSELSSPSGRVTMSCGVAELEPKMDAETLLRAADGALLRAKRQGRDRSVSAVRSDSAESEPEQPSVA